MKWKVINKKKWIKENLFQEQNSGKSIKQIPYVFVKLFINQDSFSYTISFQLTNWCPKSEIPRNRHATCKTTNAEDLEWLITYFFFALYANMFYSKTWILICKEVRKKTQVHVLGHNSSMYISICALENWRHQNFHFISSLIWNQ